MVFVILIFCYITISCIISFIKDCKLDIEREKYLMDSLEEKCAEATAQVQKNQLRWEMERIIKDDQKSDIEKKEYFLKCYAEINKIHEESLERRERWECKQLGGVSIIPCQIPL